MKIHVKLFVLFLLLIFYSFCNAQNITELPTGNTKPETKAIITSTGPKRVVRTIKQDRNGNIWLAAHDGIFRYDGKSFTNITSKMSSVRFFSMLEDRKGNFWFTSPDSGVYYYDGKSLQNLKTQQWLVNRQVPCLYEDKKGNIWFGCNEGLWRNDGRTFTNIIENPVGNIIDDIKGNIWTISQSANGEGALIRYGENSLADKKPTATDMLPDDFNKGVFGILAANDGRIWFGAVNGVYRYDGKTIKDFK